MTPMNTDQMRRRDDIIYVHLWPSVDDLLFFTRFARQDVDARDSTVA